MLHEIQSIDDLGEYARLSTKIVVVNLANCIGLNIASYSVADSVCKNRLIPLVDCRTLSNNFSSAALTMAAVKRDKS